MDEGFSDVILDGKIISCDRGKEPAVSGQGEDIDLWYSGAPAMPSSAPCAAWANQERVGQDRSVTRGRNARRGLRGPVRQAGGHCFFRVRAIAPIAGASVSQSPIVTTMDVI